MIAFLIWFINIFAQALSLLVIVKVFLSYFMSPYHPVRHTIDRIIEPILAPIRRLIPPAGMFDFSPIILLVLLQLSGKILTQLLSTIGH